MKSAVCAHFAAAEPDMGRQTHVTELRARLALRDVSMYLARPAGDVMRTMRRTLTPCLLCAAPAPDMAR